MPDMNAKTRLDGLSAAGICPGCGSVIGTIFHRCDLVRRDVHEQVVAELDRLRAENARLHGLLWKIVPADVLSHGEQVVALAVPTAVWTEAANAIGYDEMGG